MIEKKEKVIKKVNRLEFQDPAVLHVQASVRYLTTHIPIKALGPLLTRCAGTIENLMIMITQPNVKALVILSKLQKTKIT